MDYSHFKSPCSEPPEEKTNLMIAIAQSRDHLKKLSRLGTKPELFFSTYGSYAQMPAKKNRNRLIFEWFDP